MWIITDIEKRLRLLGLQPRIFAVSPAIETDWPADEALGFEGKLVGLQIKRPTLDPPDATDIGRIHWSLDSPKPQATKLMASPEIFYCLPAFLNRDIKELAADHAVFWRPDSMPPPKGAWYSNAAAKTQPSNIGASGMRWGRFLEQILNCGIGARFEAGGLASLVRERYSESLRPSDLDEQRDELLFYGIAIPIR